jgi:GntR family transcriptional regulator, carbon starvation induced regulator
MVDLPITRNEWVAARLREGILSGELAPGIRLKADALAERWSVSPTPVRESLQRLAADGLVDLEPGRGAHVAELSVKEMVEIYSIRLMLEPFALRLSLERRTPEWEAGVRAAYAALRDELEAGVPDLFRFEEIHGNLHEALIARCNSPWLLRLYRTLNDQSVRYRLLSIGPRGGAAEVLDEHERLVEECLGGGSVDEAVHSLFAHIRLTVDALLPQLSASDADDREVLRFAHAATRAASPTS